MSTNGSAQKAIAEGISICSTKLQGLVVDWVRNSSRFSDLRDLHLILFDSHEPTLAMNFLKQKAPSIFLLESSQQKASLQKDFVSDYCKLGSDEFFKKYDANGQFKDVEDVPTTSRLEAFHANMRSLLIPTKAKPFNEPFLKRLFNNDSGIFNKKEPVSTVLVGCVPNSTTQKSLLQSLLQQWVLKLHERDEETEQLAAFDKSYGLNSIYKFGNISIITLLRTGVFAKLISAKVTDGSDLNFFTNQQLFSSFMFNALFDVKLLEKKDAFSFEHFQPEVIAEKNVSFKEKLLNAGLEEDSFYAVEVRPRDEEELFETFQLKDIDLAKDIIALSFWMELASKLKKSKRCNDELSKSLGGEAYESLFEEERLVSSIGPEEFMSVFPKIRETLVVNEALAKQYNIYRDQVLGYRRDDYVD